MHINADPEERVWVWMLWALRTAMIAMSITLCWGAALYARHGNVIPSAVLCLCVLGLALLIYVTWLME